MSAARRLAKILLGESGPAPALILAGVTLVITFIVIAGPRALTSAGNRAVADVATHAPALDIGALITADQQISLPGSHRPTGLSARAIATLTGSFGRALTGLHVPPAARWGGLSTPSRGIITAGPPPQGRPQTIELGYRTGLAAHVAVIAGRLPTGSATILRGPGKRVRSVTISVAVTKVTATTFQLHPGSVVHLGSAGPGTPPTRFLVTGIVRPTGSSSAFWQYDPVLATPTLMGNPMHPFWLGGALTGPGQLTGLEVAYAGSLERAAWFFPLAPSALTRAAVPRIESTVTALSSSSLLGADEHAARASSLSNTAISTGLSSALATFNSQWDSTSGADSVVVTGLFAVGLALLLTCCALAARAYRPELELVRVRGGSLAQVAGRTLARSALITVPMIAVAAAAAIASVPGGTAAGYELGLALGVVAVVATPVICMVQHRLARTGQLAGSTRTAPRRSGLRRVVAELAILAVAVAALADVRLNSAPGSGNGTTGPYLSASAVLIAIAVGLVLNRLYRRPLRVLAKASATRPGAVGAVSLANAADRPPAAVLPALAIMLSLTLTAFSAMVLASITTGQLAGSWERVGADALIGAPGTSTFSNANLAAISRVPGVRRAAAVFQWPNAGSSGAVLQRGGQTYPVALAAVDPPAYAALAATTPWPAFPASALARSHGGSGPVPVLVSAGVAGKAGGPGTVAHMNVFGQNATVRIVGVIGRTAAMPAGGQFVIGPLWASGRLGVPGPATMLVTGPVTAAALRAAVAKTVPGSQVTLRSKVLAGLDASAALRTSRGLYRAGTLAAAVLTALAVLFWLVASANDRARLLTRLGALGMAGRQALLLGVTDSVPLLAVTAAGTAASVWLLAGVIGPVLGLNSFTGSRFPVPLHPTWADLGVPVTGAVLLAVAILLADAARSGRRNLAADLRHEEVR